MKKFFACFLIIIALSLPFGVAGCGDDDQDQGLKVYTSFYTLYDFATKIAQDKANVYNIMPAGADAHSWTPSAKDIVKLNKADIFLYNGLGLEHWTDQVIKTLDKNILIVKVSDNIDAICSDDHEHEHHHDDHDHEITDPHIWLSPKNAKIILQNIKDAFVQADPNNAQSYFDNYEHYAQQCDELDSEFQTKLKDFSKRDIVVTKNAFSYLCQEYNLDQEALGSAHQTDPDATKMSEVIKFIEDNNVKVVFYEPMSLNFAQALTKDATVELKLLNPLESLSEQDLNKGNDYFKIMCQNLEAINYALEQQNG